MAAVLAFAALSCNSTDSPNADQVPEGTYEFSADNENNYFVDSNFGGLATEIHLARQYYGRLVSVASCTPAGGIIDIVHTDFVIDPREADTWSSPFTLTTNPVDGSQMLCIAEDVNDTAVDPQTGTSPQERFLDALIEAAGGVRPVTDLGFVGVGNYTMVPRNAAFVLQFDDIIDPSTINADSIKVIQGNPPVIPFAARVFADPNYGAAADFDGNPGTEFYPTRIIIDPSISPAESLATGLSANLTGFPSSLSQTLANIQVRIPTVKPPAQINPILENPSEHSLVTSDNGTFDFGVPTRDIVRAFRSGGLTDVTGDPFSGFLPDRQAPDIIGAQGANLSGIFQPDATDPMVFTIPTVAFNSATCAQRPIEGDVITTSVGISVLVLRNNPNTGNLESGSFNSATGVANSVKVRVLTPVPSQFADDPAAAFVGNGQGAAQYTTRYDGSLGGDDVSRPECFVAVTPNSFGFPVQPNVDITTESTFTIRFSEPMNQEQMEPYESVKLTRQRAVPQEAADYISGTLRGGINLQRFEFAPIVPLEHTNGSVESFFLSFGSGDLAPKDLAGNPIGAVLNPIEYTIIDSAPSVQSGTRVSRFTSFDEEAPFGDPTSDDLTLRIPRLEWNGQGNIDQDRQRMRPRPVVREQVFASNAQPLVGAMAGGVGTKLPLNPRGARTQMLWRYIDFGLPLYEDGNYPNGLDVNRLNVDVEAAYLSPLGSNPVFESYPEFTMYMAHSLALPDEVTNNGNLLNPSSGLEGRFSENLLDQTADPLEEVHPRERGYTVNPGDQSLTPDGITTLIPLPMNQGIPEAEKEFYTWRDTALMTLGGQRTIYGAPPMRNWEVNLEHPRHAAVIMMMEICDLPSDPVLSPIPNGPNPDGVENPLYLPGQIRTAALPLLIDFRCFNSGTASSGNTFAHGLANATLQPYFRAFSAGGTNEAGVIDIVDPDAETVANGGYDPLSTPAGAQTPGLDNTVYFGALDLVVRVSRVTSIFFAAADPNSFSPGAGNPVTDYDATYTAPSFVEPAIFPTALDQPQGTKVELAYRAASEIIPGAIERENGQKMDPYGDFFTELPENYGGGDEIAMVNSRGNASCWDGSFRYLIFDPLTGESTVNDNVAFISNNPSWRTDVAQLQNARFFQVRVSMFSNVATGEVPTVSSIGFAWTN